MKKAIVALATVFVIGLSAEGGSNKFRVDELVLLPHPMKIVKNNKEELGITKEQMQELMAKVKDRYQKVIHEELQKAYKLERKIIKSVTVDHKSSEELKSELDELEALKRKVTDTHIGALNEFATVLSKEQFQKLVNIFYKGKSE